VRLRTVTIIATARSLFFIAFVVFFRGIPEVARQTPEYFG
jgi:hypothetical protein